MFELFHQFCFEASTLSEADSGQSPYFVFPYVFIYYICLVDTDTEIGSLRGFITECCILCGNCAVPKFILVP